MSCSSSPEELRELINRGLGTQNLAPKAEGPVFGARNPNIRYT